MELKEPKIISLIDLGTNSARLLVVRLHPNGSYTVLLQEKEVVRLGEGGFTHNYLQPEAIARTVVVVSHFIELARTLGSSEIIAVATSATRDASNRDEMLDQVFEQTGVQIQVISGAEEARLIWLGVSSGIDIKEQKGVFIDIGGGSTEIIVANQYETFLLQSLKLGAIRTTNAFHLSEIDGPVHKKLIHEIRQHIEAKITHLARDLTEFEITSAYGSSGTIIALESVAREFRPLQQIHQDRVITLEELTRINTYLADLPLAERKQVPGLNPDRADIIIAGGLILECILSRSGLAEIRISPHSLRDGLLVGYLSRYKGFPHSEQVPVQTRSVLQLGKSCHIDETHASHVANLSDELFRSAEQIGLHTLDEHARNMLSHAAFLHDIGQFISFSGHHLHSQYMITHVPLLGFSQQEVMIIGLIARYHRKKPPKQRDPGYGSLNEQDKETVRILSLFLRIAENLDRSHDGRVRSVSMNLRADGGVDLILYTDADCFLERTAVIADVKIGSALFSRDFFLSTSPLPRAQEKDQKKPAHLY